MRIQKFLAGGFLASGLLVSHGSIASVTVVKDGSCEKTLADKPAVQVKTSVHLSQGSIGSDSVLVRDDYMTGGFIACSANATIRLRNEPEGPIEGTTLDASALSRSEVQQLFLDFGKLWRGGVEVWRTGAITREVCRVAQCEAAASPNGTAVMVLKEETVAPGPGIMIQALGDATPAGRVAIPFWVIASGDDDWLEMSNRGQVFWKMPTSGLTLGRLYFAMIPRQFLTPGSGVWAVYLNSAGIGDSTVYVPLPSDQYRY